MNDSGAFGWGTGDKSQTVSTANTHSWQFRIYRVMEADSEELLTFYKERAKRTLASDIATHLATFATQFPTAVVKRDSESIVTSISNAIDAIEIGSTYTGYADAKAALDVTTSYSTVAAYALDGQYVTLKNYGTNYYMTTSGNNLAASEDATSANVWLFKKSDDSTNGANAIKLYNPVSNTYAGSLTGWSSETVVPTADKNSAVEYLLDYNTDKWRFITTGYSDYSDEYNAKYKYLHNGSGASTVVMWGPAAPGSQWVIDLPSDTLYVATMTAVLASDKASAKAAIAANADIITTEIPGITVDLTESTDYIDNLGLTRDDSDIDDLKERLAALSTDTYNVANLAATALDGQYVTIVNNPNNGNGAHYMGIDGNSGAAANSTKTDATSGEIWKIIKAEGTSNSIYLYNSLYEKYMGVQTSTNTVLPTTDAAATAYLLEYAGTNLWGFKAAAGGHSSYPYLHCGSQGIVIWEAPSTSNYGSAWIFALATDEQLAQLTQDAIIPELDGYLTTVDTNVGYINTAVDALIGTDDATNLKEKVTALVNGTGDLETRRSEIAALIDLNNMAVSALDGKYVSIKSNDSTPKYLNISVHDGDALCVNNTSTAIAAPELWRIEKMTDTEYGENCVALYNMYTNRYAGTMVTLQENTAIPVATEQTPLLLELFTASNKWGIKTVAFEDASGKTYFHTGSQGAIYWTSPSESDNSGWTLAQADDDQITALQAALPGQLATVQEAAVALLNDASHLSDVEYIKAAIPESDDINGNTIATINDVTLAADAMDYRAEAALIDTYNCDYVIHNLWGQLDGKTVTVKNRRSGFYLYASSANTMLGKTDLATDGLWTLQRVDGTDSQFTLYNHTSGKYYTTGTTGVQPPNLSDAENAVPLLFTAFSAADEPSGVTYSNKGYVYLKATTHTSGTSILHISGTNASPMYYDTNLTTDTGSHFLLRYLPAYLPDGVTASDGGELGTIAPELYNAYTAAYTAARGTDPAAVAAYLTNYAGIASEYVRPVFILKNEDANLAVANKTGSYNLIDPLDKKQLWTLNQTGSELTSGTAYSFLSLTDGTTQALGANITVGDDNAVTSTTIASGFKAEYVGTTAQFDRMSDNLAKALYVSAHLGSHVGEYTAASDVTTSLVEDFQANTKSIDLYLANKDNVDDAAAKILASTMNLPTNCYLRIKTGAVRSAELSGDYYLSNVNTSVSGFTSMAEFSADGTTASTIFAYTDGKLCSYENGHYIVNALYNSNAMAGNFVLTESNTLAANSGTAVTFPSSATGETGSVQFVINGGTRAVYAGDNSGTPKTVYVNGGGAPFNHQACDFRIEAVNELPVTLQSDGMASIIVPVALKIPDVEGYTFYAVAHSKSAKTTTLHLADTGDVYAANTAILVKGEAGTTVNIPISFDDEGSAGYTGAAGNVAKTAFAAQTGTVTFAKIVVDSDNSDDSADAAVAAAPKMLRVAAADGSAATEAVTFTKLDDGATLPANTMLLEYELSTTDEMVVTDNTASISITLPTTNVDPAEDDMIYSAITDKSVLTGMSELTVDSADDLEAPVYDLTGRRLNRVPARGFYIQNGVKRASI